MDVPCAYLVTTDGPAHCDLGRRFPDECPGCAAYRPTLLPEDRTRCEVWTRVMGYHWPVHAWNRGKQSEHADRQCFREAADD